MMTLFTHCRTRETEPAGADNVGLAGGIGCTLPSMSTTKVVLVVPPPPSPRLRLLCRLSSPMNARRYCIAATSLIGSSASVNRCSPTSSQLISLITMFMEVDIHPASTTADPSTSTDTGTGRLRRRRTSVDGAAKLGPQPVSTFRWMVQ